MNGTIIGFPNAIWNDFYQIQTSIDIWIWKISANDDDIITGGRNIVHSWQFIVHRSRRELIIKQKLKFISDINELLLYIFKAYYVSPVDFIVSEIKLNRNIKFMSWKFWVWVGYSKHNRVKLNTLTQ